MLPQLNLYYDMLSCTCLLNSGVNVITLLVSDLHQDEATHLTMRRYWSKACPTCAIKDQCTTARERRIRRWEHEDVLEDVERRLDEHPERMRQRRETVEHPFGTIKYWMGYTHFKTKTLKRVSTEMALHVLAYNLKRVMKIIGIVPLIAAMTPA